jgi:hypothetical protein
MNKRHGTAKGNETLDWLDRNNLIDVVLVLNLSEFDVDMEALHHTAHFADNVLNVRAYNFVVAFRLDVILNSHDSEGFHHPPFICFHFIPALLFRSHLFKAITVASFQAGVDRLDVLRIEVTSEFDVLPVIEAV